MPDPALLAIVQHFASPPPTLAQPAILADREPFLSAYELLADQQDREIRTWVGGVTSVEHQARAAVAARPHDFTPQMFSEMTSPFERYMRWRKREIYRWERRSTSRMSQRMRRLRERTLSLHRQQYEAASGLVSFLKDMQTEVAARQHGKVGLPTRTPNDTTIAAMEEAEAGGLPRFATVADLMADLHADD